MEGLPILTRARAAHSRTERTSVALADDTTESATVVRCRLADATFSDAVLVNASFAQSQLLRASFARADLSSAAFDGANLFAAGLWSAVLTDTRFRSVNLGRTTLAPDLQTRPAHG